MNRNKVLDDYVKLNNVCRNLYIEYQERPKLKRAIIGWALGYLGNRDLNNIINMMREHEQPE